MEISDKLHAPASLTPRVLDRRMRWPTIGLHAKIQADISAAAAKRIPITELARLI